MYLGYASSISNWYSSCIPSLLIVAYFFIVSVSPTARPTYRKIVRYNKIKICKSKLRISSDSVTKNNDFSVSDWLNLLWNSSTSQIWKKKNVMRPTFFNSWTTDTNRPLHVIKNCWTQRVLLGKPHVTIFQNELHRRTFKGNWAPWL